MQTAFLSDVRRYRHPDEKEFDSSDENLAYDPDESYIDLKETQYLFQTLVSAEYVPICVDAGRMTVF